MKSPLPKSIEERAIGFMLKGATPMEALRQAIDQETNMIVSLLDGSFLNAKGNKVASIISESVYKKINR